jgi:bifunctional DNA-binding transcriptional regulator/antitoxin component of YhaV-PrlF toxin-antitoxin module
MTVARLRIDKQGGLVIPAKLRRVLGIMHEEELLARTEDGRLVLETRDAVIARLRSRFSDIPAGVSLADELIAERREAARREALE